MKHVTHSIAAILLGLTIYFTGCTTSSTQTTSGRSYLNGYHSQTGGTVDQSDQLSGNIDREVRIVADVEPILRFPARIGLAKIYRGQLVNISAEEMDAWVKAKQELGKDFGEFVPLSPLIAESVYSSLNPTHNIRGNNRASEVLRKIRFGAARQHLEAVLIYESFSETNSKKLAASIANWTLIGGYFVPTRELKTVGFANALLLDVRNGYPYGTANATLTDQDEVNLYFKHDRQQELTINNELNTILKLVPEVTVMFEKLKAELSDVSLFSK